MRVLNSDTSALHNINVFHNPYMDYSSQNGSLSSDEHLAFKNRYASRPPLCSVSGLENEETELVLDELPVMGVELSIMVEESRLKLSDAVFPELDQSGSWSNENSRALTALFRCIEAGNCARNQEKGTPRQFWP